MPLTRLPAAQEGRNTLVKFHWLPAGGAKFMNDEEAQAVGSENMRHSHATLDLVRSQSCCSVSQAAPPTLCTQLHSCTAPLVG